MSKNLSEIAGRHGVDKNLFEELGVTSKAQGTPTKGFLTKCSGKGGCR